MAEYDVDAEFVKEGEERAMLMSVLELKYRLGLSDDLVSKQEKKNIYTSLMRFIEDNQMTPFYEHMCSTSAHFKSDEKFLKKLKDANAEELEKLEASEKDAIENLGEVEVRDAVQAKADFYARIGDKENAVKFYIEALEKTAGTGHKIDIMFDRIRVALFWADYVVVRDLIEETKAMVEKGGDWERRNRLKVYEATFLLVCREFSDAATLLLDSIATFTCYELYSYRRFVFYAVVATTMTKGRGIVKDQLVKSPDVLSVIRDIGELHTYLLSLHKCQYHAFMRALMKVCEYVDTDLFLREHSAYILRELRVVAYKQFLESYRSVTIKSMAGAFGVSPAHLDKVLSGFISAGRLNCKIDKVADVVETNRPDSKNAQYQSVLKQGDHVLNRIQKLSRVINY